MNAGKKIRKELNCAAPDLADKIAESVNWDKIAAENSTAKKEKKPFEKSFVWSLAAACCAVVLCLGILGNDTGKSEHTARFRRARYRDSSVRA